MAIVYIPSYFAALIFRTRRILTGLALQHKKRRVMNEWIHHKAGGRTSRLRLAKPIFPRATSVPSTVATTSTTAKSSMNFKTFTSISITFDALTVAYVLPALIPLWHMTPADIGTLISIGYAGQVLRRHPLRLARRADTAAFRSWWRTPCCSIR